MRAIDADALKKDLTRFYDNEVTAKQLIDEQSTIDPERKTGRWIDGKCNRCGTHAPFWAMATTYYCSEYCPHCGAYMVTEEEM